MMLLVAAFVVSLLAGAGQDAPVVEEQRLAWNWGELIYGRSYQGNLTVTNNCATEQKVRIFSHEAPYLTIPRAATLPPRASVQVPYWIKPTPNGQSDTVRGEVVIWHSSDPASTCGPFRVVHVVSGRTRMAVPEDARREAATIETAALSAACGVWWMRGRNFGADLPGGSLPEAARRAIGTADERRCAPVIRPHARLFRQRLVDDEIARDAVSWRWLPDNETIDRMSMADLVAFRRRAGDQLKKAR